jgi:hypothetical protein
VHPNSIAGSSQKKVSGTSRRNQSERHLRTIEVITNMINQPACSKRISGIAQRQSNRQGGMMAAIAKTRDAINVTRKLFTCDHANR